MLTRLYWITKRAGEKTGSGLMKANAWHHRADAISSVVALVGVGKYYSSKFILISKSAFILMLSSNTHDSLRHLVHICYKVKRRLSNPSSIQATSIQILNWLIILFLSQMEIYVQYLQVCN